MAEAQEVPSLGGYDEEFVNAVDDDLQCSICYLPLKDPMQTKCGHRCCTKCLDEHFKRLELNSEPLICPVDRNFLVREKDIFPDKATERKMLSFLIKCPSKGCQWTGELRSKSDHLSSCPLKIVSCTNENCSETMTRNNLQKHVTTMCPWRTLPCIHCSASHPVCKTETHQADCKKFPLNCSQSCETVIPREEMSTHILKDCPLSLISCPYDHMGCTAKIQRREVESHLQTAVRLHLDFACVKLSDTQVQLNNIQKKLEETTRQLEEKVNVLEKQMQHSEGNCNSYIWRIDNFCEVLRKARNGERTVMYSSSFYRFKYNCKLRLDPNGFGAGEGTHLSICIVIMKGKYDAMLTWPFHKKIMFMLIDQQEKVNDRENIVQSFTANPELDNFKRPRTDDNSALGFAQFASHEKLQERSYIVDDTIFMEVHITSPEEM